VILAGVALLALTMFARAATESVVKPLIPEPRHEKIAQMVASFIEKSHYLHAQIDNDLSSDVLDLYIDSLDHNRFIFLQSDIDEFEQYREKLDDMVRSEPLQPVFSIFERYRERAKTRWEFAIRELDIEPDFTANESFQFDREDSPWATSEKELDELWRQRVTYDALNLALTDQEWTESKEVLQKRYARMMKRIDQFNTDDVFELFMNSLAHTLDPHSSYLSPRNSEEYRIQMSLSYFGIGASLQMDDDYVVVSGVIPGGPAAIDGKLKPEDRIVAVGQGDDGEMVDVIGWRLDDVVEMIRGPADTVVRLQILAGDALPGERETTLTLVRNQVKLEEQAAKSEIITVPRDGRDWKIGVIDVPSFYRDYRALSTGDKDYASTTKDVRRLIGELEEQGVDGLVMDLRGNGGGHLTEATALSGLFIDNGPVVQLRNANGRISRLDDPDPVPRVAYNGPLAVLVDRFSASASEIFAAAIQDYARGVIIGQRTFGKGSVQNLYSLDQYVRRTEEEGYGQLTLTIGKYYRVTGESTQHKGVEPDIELPTAISVEDVGESARDTALPWDTISTTRFNAGAPLQPLIAALSVNHQQRSASDPDYQFLLEGIQEIDEMRNRRSVSLNLETRRKEREEARQRQLNRENKRRSALNLPTIESLDDLEDEETPDIYVEEAAAIIADMAQLREIEAAPATTASVNN
jgi:carboxyl-terminal processing protease